MVFGFIDPSVPADGVPASKALVRANFEAMHAISPVNLLEHGARADAEEAEDHGTLRGTDNRVAFAAALAAAAVHPSRTLWVPPGNYAIALAPGRLGQNSGLEVPSGVRVLGHGATLMALGTDTSRYHVVWVDEASDVTISGLTVHGERYRHGGDAGEFGFGFYLSNSRRVRLIDCSAHRCWGDGFNVGTQGGGTNGCEDVQLLGCRADDNRRQGLSIISVRNLLVEGCHFSGTQGTGPSAGIDVEPFAEFQYLENVVVRNCRCTNNAGFGVIVSPGAMSAARAVTVRVSNCVSDGDWGGFVVNNAVGEYAGHILFESCVARSTVVMGFGKWNGPADRPARVIFRECLAHNCPVAPFRAPYDSAFVVWNESRQTGWPTMGNVLIQRCMAIDDRPTPLCRRFLFVGAAGEQLSTRKGRNIYVEDPLEIRGLMSDSVACKGEWTLISDAFGQLRRSVTEDVTVADLEQHGTYHNDDAAGAITITLDDSLDAGQADKTFENLAGQPLTIDPSTSQILLLTGARGVAVTSTTRGARLRLRRSAATEWMPIEILGDWTPV